MCKKPGTECSLLVVMAAVLIAAISPAGASAAVISPRAMKPSKVTAHLVPSAPTPSPAPMSPATQADAQTPTPIPDDIADEVDRPRTRPGAHRRRYVVARTRFQEQVEQARDFGDAMTWEQLPRRLPPVLTLPNDPAPPDPTSSETDVLEPSWTEVLEEVEEVVVRIFDWLCPRSNHQRADGAVEDPHETGSCF